MARIFAVGFFLFVFGGGACVGEPLREWSNADGSYTFTAEVMDRHKGLIDLRRKDGVILRMPLAMLSKADQMYIRDGGKNAFELKGIGYISSPPGYTWKLADERKIEVGKLLVYACTGPSDNGVMLMTITPQVANGDGVRSSHLKGHFNGLLEGAPGMGVEVSQATKPEIAGSIPDRVEYQLSGLNQDKKAVLIRGATIFGKDRTFLFQIMELDNQKGMKFYEISKTLALKQGG